jgi:hypothetical protein
MSILTNAEQIRDEVSAGANTAARVGGNLVEVANDLVTKQTAITINSAKVGISTTQASAITANTAKTGITTGQASAIVANTAKVGYTEELVNANSSVVANALATVTNATAASTNATAILTKLGKSTSTIAVNEVDILTAAAYTALATKVATKLYFTT